MTRKVMRFEALCGLFVMITILATFALVGTGDFAVESGKDIDPRAFWAIPIAIVSAGLALWFNHKADMTTRLIEERAEKILRVRKGEALAAYMEGEGKGF